MNNEQFRKLVHNTPARQSSASSPSESSSQGGRNSAAPALGSRMRSSIPMTPRTIAGYNPSNDFARQLAERNQSQSSSQQKKFRATAAPKGAKLPAGYVDRAKFRGGEEEEEEGSDKAQRVKALEEMMKLGQIDEATFTKLREEILGDIVGGERAGLVRGLDWGLLERVRRGEVGVSDVLEDGEGNRKGDGEDSREGDVDDEFDRLEEKDVEAVVKEKKTKKGEMAPSELTGKKRTRDQILAEMKAARLAAKEAAQPSLGARFKKVGDRRAGSRIERDGKGREVLITLDEHGNEKRKVRKVALLEEPTEKHHGLLMPDKDMKPLGMEVPEVPKEVEMDLDVDIFGDAGHDYDPLAGLDEESSEDDEDGQVLEDIKSKSKAQEEISTPGEMAPPPRPKQPPTTRNYFRDSKSGDEPESSKSKSLTDPTILAALKKAATLNPISKAAESEEEAAKEARHKKMLQQDDRDAQDIDIGFGSSRFADEEDFEEKKVKLSEWGGNGSGDDEDGHAGRGGDKGKRKRGPKKRKGDGNSAADVMKVIERRKAEK